MSLERNKNKRYFVAMRVETSYSFHIWVTLNRVDVIWPGSLEAEVRAHLWNGYELPLRLEYLSRFIHAIII